MTRNRMSEIYKQHNAWNLKDYPLTMKNWIEKDKCWLFHMKHSPPATRLEIQGHTDQKTRWPSPDQVGFTFWDFSIIGRHVYPGLLPAFILHGLQVISKQVIGRLCFWNKMTFSPTTVFLQRQRDFILNDSLLAETRAYQQLGDSWSPAVHLFRDGKHLPCSTNFHLNFGPVPTHFVFQTHATNHCLESYIFTFTLEISRWFPVAISEVPFANAPLWKWQIHQEFHAVTKYEYF